MEIFPIFHAQIIEGTPHFPRVSKMRHIIDQINKLIISILALLVNHLFHFIVVSDDIDLIEN